MRLLLFLQPRRGAFAVCDARTAWLQGIVGVRAAPDLAGVRNMATQALEVGGPSPVKLLLLTLLNM